MAVSGRRALDNLLSTTLRFSSQAGTIVSCHPCGLSGQIVNAEGYCQNCRKYLCNSCISSHEKATLTTKHVVNKNFEFTSTADANDKLQSCSTHPNEDVKLYCRAHGRLGCVICMTLSHKLCEIDFIPEVSEQFVKSDEYLSFETNVSNIKERCTIGLSKIEANITDIETEYANVISAVENTKKEIIEELDKFEGELKDKVTTYRKKNIETMDTLKKAYESVVKNIEDKEAITKSMIKDKKYNLLFCEVKQAFALVSEYQSQTYELSTRLCKQECKFQKSTELNTFLTKEKMLGTIHIKDLELGSCNAQESVSTHPICHINIKGKNDKKTCYATGLAFMSSDQLAVADKANKNVKIVDVSYNKMISEIMLSSSPRDITVIPTNQP
ncbi:transcription intermediary factor 1-alpha-like [Mercenaria mercenaria]|uniref:transcription intermediary factor 1-alpha-like n=1 Tax=Mercenaria mercenaria TaxID=6596 RepID=UPI00234ED8D9|nr:transcription intermediary factor 1-alpha-like [Mercenaria mercenaria]